MYGFVDEPISRIIPPGRCRFEEERSEADAACSEGFYIDDDGHWMPMDEEEVFRTRYIPAREPEAEPGYAPWDGEDCPDDPYGEAVPDTGCLTLDEQDEDDEDELPF